MEKKRTNEAREEKGFEKSAPTETWLCVSILGEALHVFALLRAQTAALYLLRSIGCFQRALAFWDPLQVMNEFRGVRVDEKDSHKGRASKKKCGRFPIWRRRQFISQLTNLPDSAVAVKRGAFNCHDCVRHVKLINYGIALIMLL